jgi:hypothetical protein
MHQLIIRADGVDWPFETFVDCYRMVRLDGDYPEIARSGCHVDFVNSEGAFVQSTPAHLIDWNRVKAFGVPQYGTDARMCEECDQPVTLETFQTFIGMCESCYDSADFGEYW